MTHVVPGQHHRAGVPGFAGEDVVVGIVLQRIEELGFPVPVSPRVNEDGAQVGKEISVPVEEKKAGLARDEDFLGSPSIPREMGTQSKIPSAFPVYPRPVALLELELPVADLFG